MIDWSLAVNVTVTGIILVFAMLLLLVFILYMFGWISVAFKNAADKKASKAREEALRAMAHINLDENENENETENTIAPDNSDLNTEIIAVISAAVSSIYIGSNKKPVIKSIKKSSGRRSAWANAGIVNNTRVF